MKKQTAALLAAAGAIAGAVFALRKAGVAFRDHKRPVLLKVREDGTCGVRPVDDVELSKRRVDTLQWIVTNPALEGCGKTVDVCMTNWRLGNGTSVDPPVLAFSFCKEVKPGHSKTITAVVSPFAEPDVDYYSDVVIDGEVALDPIVRVVL
jgi:hypothetical protein